MPDYGSTSQLLRHDRPRLLDNTPPPPPPPPSPLDADPDSASLIDHMSESSTAKILNTLQPDHASPHPLSHIFANFNPSLTLENSGSVARDHLASERTFLAYVRTSLAIASAGLALVQLFIISAGDSKKLRPFARPLGTITIILGLCVLLLGLMRYFTIQTALTRGMFPVARLTIAAIAMALGAIVAAVFAISLRAQH